MRVYLCIVMKKFNGKNLRREVKRQLKELRGRVGQMAVDENAECTKVNDERLTLNEEGAVGYEMCDRHPTT